MKIEQLKIADFQSIRHLNLKLDTPITLFAGGNGAGKSSIQNAIKLALTGELSRVDLKKDQGSLIREGAKKSKVEVTVDGSGFVAELPGLSASGIASDTLPILLEPSRFAAMSTRDRKSYLLKLSDIRVSTEAVRERLLQRECDPELVEKVLPIVRSGFEAAAKQAGEYASECRGAWKATTGETYGEKKAEGWVCEAQEFDSDKKSSLAAQIKRMQESFNSILKEETELRTLQSQCRQVSNQRAELEKIIVAAREYDSEAIEATQKEIRELEAKLVGLNSGTDEEAYECPHCKGGVTLHNGSLLPLNKTRKTKAIKEEITAIESTLRELRRNVAEGAAAIEAAKTASAKLEVLEFVQPVDDDQINEAAEASSKLERELNSLKGEYELLQNQERIAKESQGITEKAARFHKQTLEWLKIKAALSPDGIPSELVQGAIGPINKRLAQSCQHLNWPIIQITDSIEITWGGRLYSLLSESEKWRTDAVIGEALADLSGIGVLLLDRFDVLDVENRASLMLWLFKVAEKGGQFIVFGTLKQTSVPRKTSLITGYWVDCGEAEAREMRWVHTRDLDPGFDSPKAKPGEYLLRASYGHYHLQLPPLPLGAKTQDQKQMYTLDDDDAD